MLVGVTAKVLGQSLLRSLHPDVFQISDPHPEDWADTARFELRTERRYLAKYSNDKRASEVSHKHQQKGRGFTKSKEAHAGLGCVWKQMLRPPVHSRPLVPALDHARTVGTAFAH
jgi:hypothetical protein